MFPNLLKDMVKDTDEQQDEDNWVKFGRVPRAGASFPVELGCTTSQDMNVFTHLESLCTLCYWDFYGGFIT